MIRKFNDFCNESLHEYKDWADINNPIDMNRNPLKVGDLVSMDDLSPLGDKFDRKKNKWRIMSFDSGTSAGVEALISNVYFGGKRSEATRYLISDDSNQYRKQFEKALAENSNSFKELESILPALAERKKSSFIAAEQGKGKVFTIQKILDSSNIDYDFIIGRLTAQTLLTIINSSKKALIVIDVDNFADLFETPDKSALMLINTIKELIDSKEKTFIFYVKPQSLKHEHLNVLLDRCIILE